MHQFFVKRSEIGNTPIVITGKDYNHMRNVLRLKQGERVLLRDGEGMEYLCRIADYDEEAESVMLEVLDLSGSAGELPTRITLFQGYPKGDKMELIVQKAVELGGYE
ncbi:MAG: RsmE family RNA methyltransferase, partial [Lachnospiraceae bacterium]|nr:RsmE family RNA methyltransferase [Lachnospiraceae bacterium]